MLRHSQQPLQYQMDRQYKLLVGSLQTNSFIFKYPYTLSHYRRGINPITALYEELQAALFKENKSKFDVWIIELCRENKDKIIYALECDCISIINYFNKYKPNNRSLSELLFKFNQYLYFFKLYICKA